MVCFAAVTRAEVVRLVRSYVDTPFLHRGREPHLALDCAGLVVCAARELGLVPPDFDVPPYTMSANGEEFMALCREYLRPVSRETMQAGDVITFIPDREPQHMGILADYVHGGLSFIHACNDRQHQRVIETRLILGRRQRFAAAFALPGIV